MTNTPQKSKFVAAAFAAGLALTAAWSVHSDTAQAGHGSGYYDGYHPNMAEFSLAYPNAIGLEEAVESAFKERSGATLLAAMPDRRSKDNAPQYLVIMSEATENGRSQSIAVRINATDGTVTEADTLGLFSRMRRKMEVEEEVLNKAKISASEAVELARAEAGKSDAKVMMIRLVEAYDVPIYAVTFHGSLNGSSSSQVSTIGVNAETGDAEAMKGRGKWGKKRWHDCDDDDDDDDDDDHDENT